MNEDESASDDEPTPSSMHLEWIEAPSRQDQERAAKQADAEKRRKEILDNVVLDVPENSAVIEKIIDFNLDNDAEVDQPTLVLPVAPTPPSPDFYQTDDFSDLDEADDALSDEDEFVQMRRREKEKLEYAERMQQLIEEAPKEDFFDTVDEFELTEEIQSDNQDAEQVSQEVPTNDFEAEANVSGVLSKEQELSQTKQSTDTEKNSIWNSYTAEDIRIAEEDREVSAETQDRSDMTGEVSRQPLRDTVPEPVQTDSEDNVYLSRRARKRAEKAKKKELKLAAKQANAEVKKRTKTIREQIKEKDRELSERTKNQRKARAGAKNVYDAIAFNYMFQNGICEVEEGLYSESIRFDDMSYQSSDDNAQRVTIKKLASMLDYFDSDSMIQYWLSNRLIPEDEIGTRVFFDPEVAGENADKAEIYNKILNDKMREGCSNIVRERVITYATSAEDPASAARFLARMRANVKSTFSSVRSNCEVLNGEQRLEICNNITRPQKRLDFSYERDIRVNSPLKAKDFICPMSLDFKSDDTCFKSDDMWCQVLLIRPNFASEITDRAIATIMDLPIPLTLSWHLHPLEKQKSSELVRTQAAWIQKEVVDKQRQALKGGWDYNMLPLELQDTKAENEALLDQIEHASQRLYYFTGFAYTYAKTREELDDQVVQIIRTAHAVGIEIGVLSLQQLEGLNSVLPVGHCHVDASRDFTTTEATILVPFTTQELDHKGGGYYGQNQISNNLVLCDRKRLMSPHGFISGMTRSGKSFAVKSEIENTILNTQKDEIYIFDITGEYAYITKMNGGTEFVFGPDAENHCNPFDLADVKELSLQSALAWKLDAILAMTDALKSEGSEDLSQEERSIITAAVEKIYRRGFAEQRTPKLEDFVQELASTEGVGQSLGQHLALMFSRLIGDSPLNFLNHESNIDFGQARLTSFNYKNVPADLRSFSIIANLENVRQRMLRNHELNIRTWIYVDEIQALFAHEAIIEYLARLWREGAKYGLICTGMTQSASAMNAGGAASTIMEQSGFLLLLKQSDRDRNFWVEMKSLSPQEESAIGDTARPGQGLIIADGARVPITGDFPKGNVLYDMFNTSPEEYEKQLEAMKDK